MKKVLVYSIKPEHMLNILNGNKTIEIRKRDLPQWVKEVLAQGEVVDGYGYCTKGKPYLEPRECNGEFVWNIHNDFIYHTDLNGKVVFKFQVSGSDVIHAHHLINQSTYWYTLGDNSDNTELIEKSCVDMGVMLKYLGLNDGYAHHFTNITPIERMELREFYKHDYVYAEQKELPCERVMKQDGYLLATYDIAGLRWVIEPNKLTKAPQSFMTAWVKGE